MDDLLRLLEYLRERMATRTTARTTTTATMTVTTRMGMSCLLASFSSLIPATRMKRRH